MGATSNRRGSIRQAVNTMVAALRPNPFITREQGAPKIPTPASPTRKHSTAGTDESIPTLRVERGQLR